MKIDVCWFKKTVSKDENGEEVWDQEAFIVNRSMLREGVVGVKVANKNEDFTPTQEEFDLIKKWVPNVVSAGTAERYVNEAKNLFFRIQVGGVANGFVRVRP